MSPAGHGPEWSSADEHRQAVARREISAVELTRQFLDRIAEVDERLGSFVALDPEVSLRQAAETDRRVARGEIRALDGVPTAVKDLTLTRDFPTRYGSRLHQGSSAPPFDADVVTAMKDGGSVLLGKTAVSEFGTSLSCETRAYPPCRNPWNLAESAGGSSGGAAAAVAAGLVPWAQGSDGGGSNRVPAALCGVFGYKPSRGLVSHGPLHSGMFGLPVNGPIARSVGDLELALETMSREFGGEPYLRPTMRHDPEVLAALVDGPGLRRPDGSPLRVGRHSTPLFAEAVVDGEVLRAWDECTAAFAALGCEIVDVPPPFDPSIGPVLDRLLAINTANPVRPDQEDQLTELTRHYRAISKDASALELIQILGQIQNACRRAMRNMPDVDIVLTPTITRVDLPLGWVLQDDGPRAQIERERQVSPFCPGYSLTGQPALAAPIFPAGSRRPSSVMLAARPGADDLLLAVARRLEHEGVLGFRPPQGPGSLFERTSG